VGGGGGEYEGYDMRDNQKKGPRILDHGKSGSQSEKKREGFSRLGPSVEVRGGTTSRIKHIDYP